MNGASTSTDCQPYVYVGVMRVEIIEGMGIIGLRENVYQFSILLC